MRLNNYFGTLKVNSLIFSSSDCSCLSLDDRVTNLTAIQDYIRTGQIHSLILLVTILNGLFQRASGQGAEDITTSLVKSGFENTRCILSGDKCYVSIENHTFRWDVRAISEALDIISSGLDTSVQINLLILYNAIPQILVRVEKSDWQDFAFGSINAEVLSEKLSVTSCTGEAYSKLKKTEVLNTSTRKFELVIHPQFYFENTRTDRFYETQLNIAPALEFSLWRGNKFTGQVIFPLQNDLGYEGDHIRPGMITISQDVKISDNLTGSVSAGNFTNGSYGLSAYLRLNLFREHCNLELTNSLIGYSHFIDQEWIHSPLNSYTGSLSIAWFWSRFNMEVKAGGARYINEDWGLFATCLRHFNETSVGLYVQKNEYNNNGGFFFSIPFPRQKRANRKLFRISLPTQYESGYNADTEYYYGQTLRTELNPIYRDRFTWAESIKNMLINYKNTTNEKN
jgi:hypothetical protein